MKSCKLFIALSKLQTNVEKVLGLEVIEIICFFYLSTRNLARVFLQGLSYQANPFTFPQPSCLRSACRCTIVDNMLHGTRYTTQVLHLSIHMLKWHRVCPLLRQQITPEFRLPYYLPTNFFRGILTVHTQLEGLTVSVKLFHLSKYVGNHGKTLTQSQLDFQGPLN